MLQQPRNGIVRKIVHTVSTVAIIGVISGLWMQVRAAEEKADTSRDRATEACIEVRSLRRESAERDEALLREVERLREELKEQRAELKAALDRLRWR